MTDEIRVGLVDDQRMFADALRMLLESDDGIEVAWVAADAETAVRHLADDRPDVVLMDVDLPGLNGIAATHEMTSTDGDVNVVVLTALSDPDLVIRAIKAGACGFVTKQRAGDQLPDIVRRAARGEIVVPPTEIGALVRRARARAAGEGPIPGNLSRRETEVLQGLTEGLSTAELAERLVVSPRTVQGHVQSILIKLGVRSKLEAVLYGLRNGIVRLRSQPEEPDASTAP